MTISKRLMAMAVDKLENPGRLGHPGYRAKPASLGQSWQAGRTRVASLVGQARASSATQNDQEKPCEVSCRTDRRAGETARGLSPGPRGLDAHSRCRQRGIGIKEIGGALTEETVFRVYVREKKAPGQVPPGEMIPAEIHGFKTDVVVVLPAQEEDDESKYRPVKGASRSTAPAAARSERSAAWPPGVRQLHRAAEQPPCALRSAGADGTETANPRIRARAAAPAATSRPTCTASSATTSIAPIARLKAGVGSDGRIEGIGFITGVAAAVSGEAVKKRGRTTELTTGTVTNLTMDSTGTKILTIEVKKNNGNDRFSRSGDSGSALLNDSNEIIGLHKEGNNGDTVAAGSFYSTSIGIQEVLDALSAAGFAITIITGSGGDEAIEPLPAEAIGFTDVMWTIEQRLKQSPAARSFGPRCGATRRGTALR